MLQPPPPIFVISLKRSTARQAYLQAQLASLGCSFEFVEAVDWQTLSARDLQMYSPKKTIENYGRELVLCEIACAMSHLNIYKKMIEEDIDEAVILEDDVFIKPGLVDFLTHRGQLPSDYFVIWLGYGYGTSGHWYFEKNVGSFWSQQKLISSHRLVKLVAYPNGAYGYLINRDGAKALLDLAYPISFVADGLLTGQKTQTLSVPLYAIQPPCVVHSDMFGSTMTDRDEIAKAAEKPQIFGSEFTALDKIYFNTTIFLARLGLIKLVK